MNDAVAHTPGPCRQRRALKLKSSGETAMAWTEHVLGEDCSGEWAVLPAGVPVVIDGGKTIEFASDQFYCYPRDRWWVAHFWGPELSILVRNVDGSTHREQVTGAHYVDICTPAERTASTISFTDLMLDVTRDGDDVLVLDEDELSEAAADATITPKLAQTAREACNEVVNAMRCATPPFDGSHEVWRRRCFTPARSTAAAKVTAPHT